MAAAIRAGHVSAVEVLEAQLAQIAKHNPALNAIVTKELLVIETPQIVQTTAQPTAMIRFTIPRSAIQHVMGPGYQELMDTIAAQGIAPAGAWFTHHLRMDPETFDFELGVPISAPFSATGRVVAGELPAVTLARAVYHGSYEGLSTAWSEFDAWLTSEGHTPGPNLWESFVAGPESSPDSANWRTELNRPLAR